MLIFPQQLWCQFDIFAATVIPPDEDTKLLTAAAALPAEQNVFIRSHTGRKRKSTEAKE